MRLALHMGRTLGELCETMSGEEFGLWRALYLREPWGEDRADARAGVIASTIANYAGKQRAENAPPAIPADFMLFADRRPEPEVEADPLSHFGAF